MHGKSVFWGGAEVKECRGWLRQFDPPGGHSGSRLEAFGTRVADDLFGMDPGVPVLHAITDGSEPRSPPTDVHQYNCNRSMLLECPAAQPALPGAGGGGRAGFGEAKSCRPHFRGRMRCEQWRLRVGGEAAGDREQSVRGGGVPRSLGEGHAKHVHGVAGRGVEGSATSDCHRPFVLWPETLRRFWPPDGVGLN